MDAMMPSQGNWAYGTRSDESTKLQTPFAQQFLIGVIQKLFMDFLVTQNEAMGGKNTRHFVKIRKMAGTEYTGKITG